MIYVVLSCLLAGSKQCLQCTMQTIVLCSPTVLFKPMTAVWLCINNYLSALISLLDHKMILADETFNIH